MSATATPSRAWLLQAGLPCALAILIVAPRCLHPIVETDAGWHLALGRTILASGIPHANQLAWTARDMPWYPTSWLFDVAAWLSISAGGVLGLQLFLLALVAGALIALTWASRLVHRHGGWAVPGTALLLLPRITERPHVATWLILATVLGLCLAARDRGWVWRAACLPVLVLGSNLHAGSAFAVGVFGLFSLEALARERRWGRELTLMALGALTLLANPGGLFNARYLLENLHVPEILRVGEIESPTLKRAPLFFGSAVVALAAAWVSRRKHPLLLPLTAIFFAFGCYGLRFVYPFAVVIAPVLASGLPWLEARSRRLELGTIALALLVVAVGRERYWGEHQIGAYFDPATLPVGAARVVAADHLGAHGFTGFRDGGYLEYADPDVLAFQDGRVQAFPPAFFHDELQAEGSPATFQQWLRTAGVEWALTSRVKEQLDGWRLLGGPDWALIYWDDASELYVRRDVPRFAGLIAAQELRTFRPDRPMAAVLRWPTPQAEEFASEVRHDIVAGAHTADAALARCLADERLASAEAPRDCEEATEIAGASQLRVLAAIARERQGFPSR